jgi:uncharacterized protein (TIGR03118 family)
MSGTMVPMQDMMNGLNAPTTPTFVQTNLISDGSVPATKNDPNLVNPWGLSSSPTGRLWIAENGAGVASVDSVTGSGTTTNVIPPVTIPGPAGTDKSSPTGQVFNSFANDFKLSDGSPATFLFATEDGTISGWNTAAGKSATTVVDNSKNAALGDATTKDGAVYKGMDIGKSDAGATLYAANFRHGTVDMYDTNFKLTKSFTDPTVPAGYAPFDVKAIDGKLFVTFAQQDAAKQDDVAGAGHGFVDEFDMQGQMIGRLASGGTLNSPWGLATAPASFGNIAGDLLVGNFGDGTISVFDQNNNKSLGQLTGGDGKPISIDGLWSLTAGNGGSGGDPNKVYFTAGPQNETHGLFGSLGVAPTTAV